MGRQSRHRVASGDIDVGLGLFPVSPVLQQSGVAIVLGRFFMHFSGAAVSNLGGEFRILAR